MDPGQTVVEIDRSQDVGSEDLDDLSNTIFAKLKELLNRAVAGSDYNQREALSAMIEDGLVRDESGMVQLDEDELQDLLERWGDIYS